MRVSVSVPVGYHCSAVEQVVPEMNRLGMMVDVSHVSDETFFDVLRMSRAPVIASYSSCRAVADHIRNVNDGQLRVLAENGGVIMINFYPAYIDEEASRKTKAYFDKWKSAFEAMKAEHAADSIALGQARRAHFAATPWPRRVWTSCSTTSSTPFAWRVSITSGLVWTGTVGPSCREIWKTWHSCRA